MLTSCFRQAPHRLRQRDALSPISADNIGGGKTTASVSKLIAIVDMTDLQ